MPAAALAQLAATLRRARFRLQRRPAVGRVQLGQVRRLQPVSDRFGFDRGWCIDRYYIERFLDGHRGDVKGHVLEVKDNAYTLRFGGAAVTRSDVLDVVPQSRATVVLDLSKTVPDSLRSAFDCIILTQTLHLIYELETVVQNVHRLLKPGGVVLATSPGISKLTGGDRRQFSDYWRVTSDSARRLFGDVFGPGAVEVEAFGNVLAAIGFLHGLAVEDLSSTELDVVDPDFEVIVGVRARK